MMNKTLATTLAVISASSLFLATGAQAQQCPNVSTFILTAKENHLDLNDNRPLCVEKTASGEIITRTFEIRIHPAGQLNEGDVTVEKKEDNTAVKITGDNEADADRFTVTVSGNAGAANEFRYLIKVKDIGVLDPTVRVVGNNVIWQAQMQALLDVLTANGITPQEASTLFIETERYLTGDVSSQ